MKVLVIWEEIPEGVKAYLVEGELADKALKCAGLYINSSAMTKEQEEQLDWLSQELVMYDALDPTIGPLEGPFDKVVICGFIM